MRPIAVLLVVALSALPAGAEQLSRTVTISWDAVGWIVLEVHDDLFLGTVDKSYFDSDTQSFKPLESLGNPILVACNYPQGCTLTVQVVDWQVPGAYPGEVPADFLADFRWRLSGETYQPLGTEEVTVWSADGPAVAALSVDYRYALDVYDVPGQYAVTLLYTASAP